MQIEDISVINRLSKYSGYYYFKFHIKLLLVMNGDCAIYLSYLLHWLEHLHKTGGLDNPEGAFYHTSRKIEQELLFPEWRQEKILKKLKSKGYISTFRKGIPAKRYFLIDFHKLDMDIEEKWLLHPANVLEKSPQNPADSKDAADQLHLKPADQLHLKPADQRYPSLVNGVQQRAFNKRIEKNKNTAPLRSAVESPLISEIQIHDAETQPSSKAVKMAKLLWKVRKAVGMTTRASKKKAAKCMDSLHKSGARWSDIREVLEWYFENCDGKYVPRAFSGDLFRLKYNDLRLLFKKQQREKGGY